MSTGQLKPIKDGPKNLTGNFCLCLVFRLSLLFRPSLRRLNKKCQVVFSALQFYLQIVSDLSFVDTLTMTSPIQGCISGFLCPEPRKG